MGKKSKLIISKPFVPTKGVYPSELKEAPVCFNFKSLYQKNGKFCYDGMDEQYFLKLIERLKELCKFRRIELVNNHSKSLRFHQIDFRRDADLSERTFGILGHDVDDDAWQFELSVNEHGRVHGYFIENIFYIVWLDPRHELYPA